MIYEMELRLQDSVMGIKISDLLQCNMYRTCKQSYFHSASSLVEEKKEDKLGNQSVYSMTYWPENVKPEYWGRENSNYLALEAQALRSGSLSSDI